MEAAKAAVAKITGRTGHRTDVDEIINPAVTSETVKPHRHEETTEAVDREVHQHHYHTTVQPISHTETLPEKHTHNLIPQVKREFKRDNEAETHRRVSAELGQFVNTSTTHETTHSTQAAPQVIGEHVHHHVHETVQPVIHKETIQPEVVHTTVPIHETHHETAKHHGLSALPMKTLDEFTKAGGLITGSKSSTHEEYEGAPRPYNEKLKTTIEKVLPGHHGTHGTHDGSVRPDSGVAGVGHSSGYGGTGTGVGHNTSGLGSGPGTGVGHSGLGGTGTGVGHSGYGDTGTSTGLGRNVSGTDSGYGTGVGHSGLGGTGTGTGLGHNNSATGSGYGTGVGHSGLGSGTGVGQNTGYDTNLGGSTGRATMGEKMDPRIDADRDGRAGVMD